MKMSPVSITAGFNVVCALIAYLSLGNMSLRIALIAAPLSVLALKVTPEASFFKRAYLAIAFGTVLPLLIVTYVKFMGLDRNAPIHISALGMFVMYTWYMVPGIMISTWINWDLLARKKEANSEIKA